MAEIKGPMPESRPFLDAFDLKAGVDIQVPFFGLTLKINILASSRKWFHFDILRTFLIMIF